MKKEIYGHGEIVGDGQLGHNSTSDWLSPKKITQIPEGIKFNKISAGANYTVAIDEEGNIWSCGLNSSGQLGDNSTTNSLSLKKITQVPEGTKFTEISCGNSHTIALDKEGNIWTWGNNSFGELGDGSKSDSYIPKKVNLN